MAYQGAGHSIGLHSNNSDRALQLGMEIPTCRVIVNQAHTFATGGSFTNGMPFSLSMGCGSWGNSIDDNVHWKHFMQTTKIIREIPPREPKVEDIFRIIGALLVNESLLRNTAGWNRARLGRLSCTKR